MSMVSDSKKRSLRSISKLPSVFMHRFHGMVDFLESSDTMLMNCIFTFFACLLLRNFFEAFAVGDANILSFDSRSTLINLTHFDASFIAVALALSLALHYVTRTPIVAVLKALLPCFIILSVAPIFDYLSGYDQLYGYSYFDPNQNVSLIYSYITYYGQFAGASIGIKVEVALALIGLFAYCYYKSHSLWKGLLGCWFAYTIIFIYGASQIILKNVFDIIGIVYVPSGLGFLRYFLVINLLLGIWVVYLADKKSFISVLSEIPFLRIFNYELMLLLGLAMGLQANPFMAKAMVAMNPEFVGDFILLFISIVFALLVAMMVNNQEDVEIDKISNSHRAVVSGRINQASYSKIANAFFVLSMVYAAPVGVQGVFFIALVMSIYYIYSVYPLRLKRLLMVSKLAISFNSLLLIMLGYWIVSHHYPSFSGITYLALFLFFTLAANFIDLKDVEGDRAAGINTLPVVLGMRKAQFLCGAAFFASYLVMALIVSNSLFTISAIILGALQFYLLVRKNYQERPVLIVYLASILCLIVFEFGAQYFAAAHGTMMPMMMPQQYDGQQMMMPEQMMPPPSANGL